MGTHFQVPNFRHLKKSQVLIPGKKRKQGILKENSVHVLDR